MNVTAIVAEYNPFHNGHLYHLNQSKEITNADYTIAIMSGDFLQRGYPALIDKYSRAKMACLSGVDIVFELPCVYSLSSAEYFATASVLTLARLGVVNSICFGAECDDLSLLTHIAQLLLDEPKEYITTLKMHLKSGLSYPKARSLSLTSYMHADDSLSDIINQPNNILAIEYIKAILKFKLPIKPYIIKRKTAMYHDISLNSSISSATAIRHNIIDTNSLSNIVKDVPIPVYNQLSTSFHSIFPILPNDFSDYLNYSIIFDHQNISSYMDVNEDISDRIVNLYNPQNSFHTFAENLKTKQYTLTRVNRLLMHIILKHDRNSFQEYINNQYVYYGRLLSFRKESSSLIKTINSNTSIPIINKLAVGKKQLDKIGIHMLENDISASTLYNQVVFNRYKTIIPNDYTHNIEII